MYRVLETVGDDIGGSFSALALPEDKPLLRFFVNQQSDAVEVEIDAPEFTTIASNPVMLAVTRYLDRISPTATGDLANVLGEFQGLPSSQLAAAASSLSPVAYGSSTSTTFSLNRQFNQSLGQRMETLRVYALGGAVADHEKPLLLAYSGSDVSRFLPPSPDRKNYGFWLKVLGQEGDQNGDGGYIDYDFSLRGLALGIDRTFGNHFIAGLGVGYSHADIDLSHDSGDGDIDYYLGSVYGSYFRDNFFLDGIISFGRNCYDNHRLVTVDSIQRDVYSDHKGDHYSGYLGGGYFYDIGKWSAGPIASLQYTLLDEESFSEKGGGSVGLLVGSQKTDALVSEAGLRVRREFEMSENVIFIPELSASWLHDFAIDDNAITASFAGSPGLSFAIPGQDADQDGVTLRTGITWLHRKGFSLSFNYQGDFRSDYRSHGVAADLRYAF